MYCNNTYTIYKINEKKNFNIKFTDLKKLLPQTINNRDLRLEFFPGNSAKRCILLGSLGTVKVS